MNVSLRVALLIDADNVSGDVIEQAVQRTIAEYGSLHVRRAYCNAETALKLQALFRRLLVRPMVNLSAGKNSTDIAMAVDAVDLVIAERPDVVVLVSSDSDFAPLVIRLREKGCRVCGIGQQGKTGDETVAIYDSFVDLLHHAPPKAVPAKRTTRRARSAPPPAPSAPALPDEALRILDAVAELASGGKVELNLAAERLRAAGLLSKSASSPRLFKKHPELFLLTPEKTPNKVQYVGPRFS